MVKTQAYTRMSLTCGNAVTPKKQPRKPHEAFSLPPEILYWCGQKRHEQNSVSEAHCEHIS